MAIVTYWYDLSLEEWFYSSLEEWNIMQLGASFSFVSLMPDPPLYVYYYIYNGDIDALDRGSWYINTRQKHCYKIYSDFESLQDNSTVVTREGFAQIEEIDIFHDKIEESVNMSVVSDRLGGEDIELNNADKIVNMIFDKSGSMNWNDSNNVRYTVAQRMIDKFSSSYPGSLEYNIFTFGGKETAVLFTSYLYNTNPLDNPPEEEQCWVQNDFVDYINNVSGYRVVRKQGSFPLTPIDGNILYDGLVPNLLDNQLTASDEYFYKVYSYDADYVFSDGVSIKVTPRDVVLPNGIKVFQGKCEKGSGIRRDSNTVAIWHFDEGKDNIVYDFMSQSDLTISATSPRWLNKLYIPVGESGIRLNENSSGIQGNSTAVAELSNNGKLSILAWIKPYDIDNDRVIFARQTSALTNYTFFVNANAGLSFSTGVSTVNSKDNILSINTWNHIACTVDLDSNEVQFFLNGSLISVGALADTSVTSGEMNLDIGWDRRSIYSSFFGEVTEVSVHNVVRDFLYISSNSAILSVDDTDNGDRLVVLKYTIPSVFNYVDGQVKIINKTSSFSSNEDDGEMIYEATAVSGNYYFTYYDNLIDGTNEYYKIFTKNIYGNYCHILDATGLELEITAMSEEALQNLDDVNLYAAPQNVVIQNGNRKNYIKWDNTFWNASLVRMKLYCSTEGYPSIDDQNSSGDLIFEGTVYEDLGYVHRNITNGINYYYALVGTDRYGRVSEAATVAASPLLSASEVGIPLIDVEGLKYELLDESSISLSWDDIISSRYFSSYFNQDIVFYLKLAGKYGDLITDEFQSSADITSSVKMFDDAAPDVFYGETSVSTPDPESLYNLVISQPHNGLVKATITTPGDLTSFKNVEKLLLNFKIKIFLTQPTQAKNVFEYISIPIDIEIFNPISLSLSNRDKKTVTLFNKNIISSLNNQIVDSYESVDGIYLGASEPFVERATVSYRGENVDSGTFIKVALYNIVEDGGVESVNLSATSPTVSFSSLKQSSSDVISTLTTELAQLDISGNPTNEIKTISYADSFIYPPKADQKCYLYTRIDLNGFVLIKRTLISFQSPLVAELSLRRPISDGIDVAEQFVSIYKLDPDNPQNESLRTVPSDLTVVKWTLTSEDGNSIERIIKSTDTTPKTGEVLSYIRDGVARNVFLGPLSGIVVSKYSNDGDITYQKYNLSISAFFDNNLIKNSQEFEFKPLKALDSQTASSFFLMEFENFKNKLWTDGIGYARMLISNNANTSTSKYSNCFRECMDSLDKPIYELNAGDRVLIDTSNPDVEIIWGDVVEIIDPYTGQSYLDTTNASIQKGSAYIEIEEGNITYIYFRMNKFITDQSVKSMQTINNNCSCFGLLREVEFEKEVIVAGSVTVIRGDKVVTLQGGGSLVDGLPPTIIIPKEALQVNVVGKRAGGIAVESFIIDGVSSNEFLLDVSFGGIPVEAGSVVDLETVNYYRDSVYTTSKTAYTYIALNPSINADYVKSYANVVLNPIAKGNTFGGFVYITFNHSSNGVQRSITSCIRVEYDVDDIKEGASIDEIPSIFSKRIERYNLDAGLLYWEEMAQMNEGRGHLVTEVVDGKIYAIGGLNGSIVSKTIELYDSSNDTWSLRANMPTARFGAASAVYGQYIYVLGGVEYDLNNNVLYVSRAVERYNTITNTWEVLSEMPMIDAGGVDRVPYGVAFCNSHIINSKIYIVSGIRYMSEDGTLVDHNDRILYYNVSTDLWVYSDIIDTADINDYQRLGAVSFVSGNIITVHGGILQDYSGDIYYLNSAYDYNVDSGLLSDASMKFDNNIEPRYYASCASFNNQHYVIGGIGEKSFWRNTFETISENGSSVNPVYSLIINSINTKSNNSSSSVIVNSDGNDFIYNIGGMQSGKGNGFLKIESQIYPNNLFLNDHQYAHCDIRLYDENGDSPVEQVELLETAYTQSFNLSGNYIPIIKDSYMRYIIELESSELYCEEGQTIAIIKPRSDDVLDQLDSSNLSVQEGESTGRYKIVLQTAIVDDFYYGQTFINSVKTLPVLLLTTGGCVSSATNISIASLTQSFNNSIEDFTLLTSPLRQNDIPYINAVSDIAWVPSVHQVTTDGAVDGDTAKLLIEDLQETIDIGSSPLFDSVCQSVDVLSNVDYDETEKLVYVFTDKEPNSSRRTLDETISEVNSVYGYPNCPVVIANLALGDRATSSVMQERSVYGSISLLASETGGQVISFIDASLEDEMVNVMVSKSIGSVSTGSVVLNIELEEKSSLESLVLYFRLYDNSSGEWKLRTSIDGQAYTAWTEIYNANTEAFFNSLICKYIQIEATLNDGLTLSNAIVDDFSPRLDNPAITNIQMNIVAPRDDYIYINAVDTVDDLQQVVISSESNYDNTKDNVEILVGASTWNNSHNWIDFSQGGKLARNYNGKLVIPFREGEIDGLKVEPLINTDGYLWETSYGSWDPDASVSIYTLDDSLIPYDEYEIHPREGYVVFAKRQTVGMIMNIINVDKVKAGIKITNFTFDENVNFGGFSYMYTIKD